LPEHCAGCRLPLALLPPALLLTIRQLTLFTKNPSKSTLAHNTVAAAVLHKHHPIIRVGAGLVQFVYGSHSRWATGVTSSKILSPPSFGASGANRGIEQSSRGKKSAARQDKLLFKIVIQHLKIA